MFVSFKLRPGQPKKKKVQITPMDEKSGNNSWRQERSRIHNGEEWYKWKGCHGKS